MDRISLWDWREWGDQARLNSVVKALVQHAKIFKEETLMMLVVMGSFQVRYVKLQAIEID